MTFRLRGHQGPLALVVDANTPTDTIHTRLEMVRQHLEEHLGLELFMKVYKEMRAVTVDTCEEDILEYALSVMDQSQFAYFPLIVQLITAEIHLQGE